MNGWLHWLLPESHWQVDQVGVVIGETDSAVGQKKNVSSEEMSTHTATEPSIAPSTTV